MIVALLKGKTAVITGGSTGIGLATAKRFVEEGAYVFINGRSQAELDAAIKEIGENVTGVQGDGSKQGDRDRLYAAVADAGRRLDVVFANAAVIDVARIGEVTQEHLQKALPLLNDGGSIILNSSNPNAKGNDGIGVYAAIKAALQSVARTWESELRDRKIRVSVIGPGATETSGIDTLADNTRHCLCGRDNHGKVHFIGDVADLCIRTKAEHLRSVGVNRIDSSAECATDYAEQQFATVLAQQGGLGLAQMIAKGLDRRHQVSIGIRFHNVGADASFHNVADELVGEVQRQDDYLRFG